MSKVELWRGSIRRDFVQNWCGSGLGPRSAGFLLRNLLLNIALWTPCMAAQPIKSTDFVSWQCLGHRGSLLLRIYYTSEREAIVVYIAQCIGNSKIFSSDLTPKTFQKCWICCADNVKALLTNNKNYSPPLWIFEVYTISEKPVRKITIKYSYQIQLYL